MAIPKKKKKTDYVALTSPFMRIPRMHVDVARDLLDLGFRQVYELEGRSPEVLYADLKKRKGEVPEDRLCYFRMAVYYSENPDPDPRKMRPEAWLY